MSSRPRDDAMAEVYYKAFFHSVRIFLKILVNRGEVGERRIFWWKIKLSFIRDNKSYFLIFSSVKN